MTKCEFLEVPFNEYFLNDAWDDFEFGVRWVASGGYSQFVAGATAANLAAARAALEAPIPAPIVVESVEAFMRRVAGLEWLNCPHCGEGVFRVAQAIPRTCPARHHEVSFFYCAVPAIVCLHLLWMRSSIRQEWC